MMKKALLLSASLLFSWQANALTLSDLTQNTAGAGINAVLEQGADMAIKQLSQPGGYNNNPEVRIEIPGNIGKAAKTLKTMGLGKQINTLEQGINQAAEASIPAVKQLLMQSINQLTIADSKQILSGPNNSATLYLEKTSRSQLKQQLLPKIQQATNQTGALQQYNALAAQASSLGLLKQQDTSLEGYITDQALDGLFKVLGDKEAYLRENPAEAATSAASKLLDRFK